MFYVRYFEFSFVTKKPSFRVLFCFTTAGLKPLNVPLLFFISERKAFDIPPVYIFGIFMARFTINTEFHRRRKVWNIGGAQGGPNCHQAHDVVLPSMRRNNVTSTSVLMNQCQIITFLILKSDIMKNSRIELRGIVLLVPSNQIKVTFIIILPLVHL